MTDRLIRLTTALAVATVAAVAAVISYRHAYELVRSHRRVRPDSPARAVHGRWAHLGGQHADPRRQPAQSARTTVGALVPRCSGRRPSRLYSQSRISGVFPVAQPGEVALFDSARLHRLSWL